MLRGITFFSQYTVFQLVTSIRWLWSFQLTGNVKLLRSSRGFLQQTRRPRRVQTLHNSYWRVCTSSERGRLVNCNTQLQPALFHLLKCHVKSVYTLLARECFRPVKASQPAVQTKDGGHFRLGMSLLLFRELRLCYRAFVAKTVQN